MNPATDVARSLESGNFSVTRSDPQLRARQWLLTTPLRWYLHRFPIRRGKGLAHAIVMRTAMRDPQDLDVTLPCGAKLWISTGEVIGQNLAIRGEFETAELAACSRLARPGSVAVDVGANVGIFTLTLAQAVGAHGRVFAFEPLAYNHRRLVGNVERNGYPHVEALLAAAGAEPGFVEIQSAGDPAYVSMKDQTVGATGGANRVPVHTLDEIWVAAGRPAVSFVKIDVEGAEPAVIAGGGELISSCRPHLLVEAPTEDLRRQVEAALGRHGLRPTRPAGFEPWNYLYVP